MSTILTKQNEKAQLDRIAAARYLYRISKQVLVSHAVLSVPLAVTASTVAFIWPEARPWTALYGVSLTLLDLLWFTPWQKRLRREAAAIQEAFDCDVLVLSWNQLRTGKRVPNEREYAMARAYDKVASQYKPIKEWYSKEIDGLPIHVARIACQRANCWWDATLRRKVSRALLWALSILFGTVFITGMLLKLPFDQFVMAVILPIMPAILFGVRHHMDQKEAANRLDELREHADQLWLESMKGTGPYTLEPRSRQLQDEIFDNRKKNVPVLDKVFNRLRDKMEAQMNHSTAQLAKEAKERLGQR